MTFYAATLRQQQRLVTRRRGSTVIGPGVRGNVAYKDEQTALGGGNSCFFVSTVLKA